MSIRDGKIKLSPSALNLFLECQRCFWQEQVKNIHRPRGIFPSLPGGMDLLIKKYFDKYRNINQLPPDLIGKMGDVKLFDDQESLNKWRNWREALTYEDADNGAVLSGMLDDLGVENGLFVPLDYKTRGFDVKEGGESFYQNQLDSYGLLLRENGMKPSHHAYLIYYIPKEVSEKGAVRFDVVPKEVAINPDSALKIFQEAIELIKGPEPTTHSQCDYCSWGQALWLQD
ncbi:MAG: PD-(D/E)XK nuclease family protein [bacterium]|nr:PD-(D/E)XK nuclease family protein [bacterium]